MPVPIRRTFAGCAALFVVVSSGGCGLDLSGSNGSLDDDGGITIPVDGSAGANDASRDAAGGSDGASLDGAIHQDAGVDSGHDAGGDGCASSVENCDNGVDDDCDGLVDCADPMCGGFECVPAAPSGWTGYFRVATGGESSTAAACPTGGAATTLYANPAGAADCTTCSCPVTGAECSPPSIGCVAGSATCGAGSTLPPADWTSSLDNGACDMPTALLPPMTTSLSCEITRPTAVTAAGSCTPSAVSFANTAKFATQVDVCGAAIPGGGGCSGGNVCVPKSGAPYSTTVCVESAAATSCPPNWGTSYPTYTSANDTRACTQCECTGPTTSCTGGSYTFFDLDGCAGDGTGGTSAPVTISSSACANVSALLDDGSWSAKATLPAVSTSCTPSGGVAMGSVSPMGAMLICCQ